MTPHRWETALALALLTALQFSLVLNPAIAEVDSEEMWNAGQAWQMLECHFGSAFLLQYRDFCGGCSLNALLGMGIFSVLGRSWLAWKVVPILFVLLLGALGSHALHRLLGRPASWAFLALLVLPPRTWLFLSSVGWGNHYEAGCLALGGLCLLTDEPGRKRTFLAGCLLGLATFTSFSGAFAIPAALAWALLGRRRAGLISSLALGIALGLSPWLVQWLSSGLHPFVTIYEGGEAAPSLARIPYKLGTLLGARQLVALFGLPATTLGWWLGWLWAAAAASCLGLLVHMLRQEPQSARPRSAGLGVLLFIGFWLAMYSVVRFQVHDPPAPEIAYPLSARYAAPLFPLLFFAIALAVGWCWQSGRRILATVLISLPLLGGLSARVESLQAPFPSHGLERFEAVDWEFLRPGFGTRLPMDALESCASQEPRTRQLHAYALGREQAASQLRSTASLTGIAAPTGQHRLHWWQGVGEATARHYDQASLYPSGQVEPLTQLRMSETALKTLAPTDKAGLQAALRAAASTHYVGRIDWPKVQGGWDDQALSSLERELRAVQTSVQLAGWWAQGLDCGRALTDFHRPREISLPAGLEGVPVAFFEGLGTALGERWGPLTRIPRPMGLPLHAGQSLQKGYSAGVARRWIRAEGALPPQVLLPQ
jgi:hypothetical protein